MTGKITRRKALKFGTTAAFSAAIGTQLSLTSEVNPTDLDRPSGSTLADSSAAPASDLEICFMPARQMADLIRQKKLSAREVMQAHLKQINRVNPKVNAIVTTVPEDRLMAQAAAADEALAKGNWLGPLHGLPVGVKDLHETQGIRTTYGSPLLRDFVPDFDCRVVQREKNAGAIVIGKTNVPEFGLGSQTFNSVFGPTRNPYDVTKTCGGSTGGGCVALACGIVPLADGSDMGGSLRNPPNFCNVVGIRCSPGRVPNVPANLGWFTLSVPGPVARNVADCAFFLSVLAGYDHHSPISIDQPGTPFAQPLGDRSFKGVRFFFLMIRRPPRSPLFPYTTLFRAAQGARRGLGAARHARAGAAALQRGPAVRAVDDHADAGARQGAQPLGLHALRERGGPGLGARDHRALDR